MPVHRNLGLWVLFATVVVTGCSASTVRAYSGPKLSATEVSVLIADRGASPSGVAVVIRRVNGIDVVRKESPAIEVIPGTQVVQIELLRGGTANDGYAETRSFNTISFDTLAGNRYRVQGTFENGLGKVWVVGQDDVPVPSQPLRTKE